MARVGKAGIVGRADVHRWSHPSLLSVCVADAAQLHVRGSVATEELQELPELPEEFDETRLSQKNRLSK